VREAGRCPLEVSTSALVRADELVDDGMQSVRKPAS
jgi:hypothetical protein